MATKQTKTASTRSAAKPKAATKKTATKKQAAKKPAAKPAATKKAAVKKAAAAKKATKKAPAKKPAAKKAVQKAPAKKPAAKKAAQKAPAKKPPAKRAASRSAPAATKKAPPKKKKVKSPFSVGDHVVYPHHGAAIIKGRQRLELDGAKTDYFVIEAVTNPLVLRIPADRALDLGLRPVISRNAARKVFAIIKEDPVDADATWARWFKLLQDKMSSGDIYEVASVVRDLTYAQQAKPLGPA